MPDPAENAMRIMGNVARISTLRNKTVRIAIDLNEQTSRNHSEMSKLWDAYNQDAEIQFVGFAIDGKQVTLTENAARQEIAGQEQLFEE